MPYEFWSAAAAIGTFIVIAATAIAAIIQLRHLRANNELNAVLAVFGKKETPSMQHHFSYVRNEFSTKMKEPSFRSGFREAHIDRAKHPEMYVIDFYDQIGQFVLNGLVSERSILMQEAYLITAFWDLLKPAIAIMRRDGGDYYLGFEFIASRANVFVESLKHKPLITFGRTPIQDPWLEIDRQF